MSGPALRWAWVECCHARDRDGDDADPHPAPSAAGPFSRQLAYAGRKEGREEAEERWIVASVGMAAERSITRSPSVPR